MLRHARPPNPCYSSIAAGRNPIFPAASRSSLPRRLGRLLIRPAGRTYIRAMPISNIRSRPSKRFVRKPYPSARSQAPDEKAAEGRRSASTR
jgi:hypothetical protein